MSDGKKGVSVWVWVAVAVGGLFVLMSIAAPLAIYGVRKYMVNAKRAEAVAALATWSDGMVRCGESSKLPPSSAPVPASLASISARKYQSAPGEWNEPAYTCAGFKMVAPQYFQYSWELSSASAGTLHARGDLNGDGAADADASLDVQISCSAGKCLKGPQLNAAGDAVPTGRDDGASSGSDSGSKSGGIGEMLLGIWVLVCLGALAIARIFMILVAFGEGAAWGLVVIFVPCGGILFSIQHWERAKKAFFAELGAFVLLIVGGLGLGGLAALSDAKGSDAPTAAPLPAFTPPPVVSAVPIPELDGSAMDLSTVMGRARKLANAWQPDAALLGVEANLVGGKIQTQDGATAKVTFGPSPFAGADTHPGLFVVIYDKSGITGAPAKGTPGKVLPEPMCAPEGVLPRLDDNLKGSPITLRYGLDGSQRPAWLVSLPGDPKPLRAYAPDDCSPRGTFVARPKR